MKRKTQLQLDIDMVVKMKKMIWLWCWWVLVVHQMSTKVTVVVCAGPEAKLLNKGCSQFSATDLTNFQENLNASFADIRTQLLANNNSNTNTKHFATAQHIPIYAMLQCRNYMSTKDCLACYDVAQSQIRNCTSPSNANGARVIYEGCFLRLPYPILSFFFLFFFLLFILLFLFNYLCSYIN